MFSDELAREDCVDKGGLPKEAVMAQGMGPFAQTSGYSLRRPGMA